MYLLLAEIGGSDFKNDILKDIITGYCIGSTKIIPKFRNQSLDFSLFLRGRHINRGLIKLFINRFHVIQILALIFGSIKRKQKNQNSKARVKQSDGPFQKTMIKEKTKVYYFEL